MDHDKQHHRDQDAAETPAVPAADDDGREPTGAAGEAERKRQEIAEAFSRFGRVHRQRGADRALRRRRGWPRI